MKNLLVIVVLALSLTSFQARAQCCTASKSDKTGEINNNLQTAKTVKFKITGITCAGCSNTIYSALKEVDGVLEHSVEYPGDIAIIEFDDSKTNIEALKKVIEKKGYKVELLKENIKGKV
ncbi:Copper chaperone CopZ [Gillisia sp. Hel1_33_143]|uniref:heavy-metal-associated domain-containing protein n=1 Tax=unclassified Gillisia TaxID=2615025 RepID=UPI00087C5D51|nr:MULTISPECIES: heavy-metal-associated domain-containing protein [unclassified Gillisia]SDR68222.1 Copper chaperone CopZ [Gillisia sp. Hel1_33_143]